jgi:hypothetical protein
VNIFMVFRSPSRKKPGWYFKLGHARLLPYLFKSIIQ